VNAPLSMGAIGGPVGRLQRELQAHGYRILDDEGEFGASTHNAVLALQARAGLPITGEVSALEWAATHGAMAAPRPDPVLLPDAEIPFIEARYWKRGITRDRVLWIVLHSMEAPEASTRAERCARFMAELAPNLPSKQWKSAHKFFDCDSCVHGVRAEHVAYHAPGGNRFGIGYEHAGYARQTEAEWLDDFSRAMLSLSAQSAARDCKRWGIPVQYVGAEGILAGAPGITTHMQFSRAFPHPNAHQDPGAAFPIAWYLDRVQRAQALL
jgi:hypothetical protein